PAAAVVHSYGVAQDNAARTGAGATDVATSTIDGVGVTFGVTVPAYSMSVVAMGGATCPVTLTPASQDFPKAGGDAQVQVMVGAECNWTASASDSWIAVHTPSGVGNGNVSFSVLENTTGQMRSGTLMVGSRSFAVTQDGGAPANCTFSIDPVAGVIRGAG